MMRSIVLSLAILLFSTLVYGQHPCLIAHFPFDSSYMDVSGSGYHGTNYGTTFVNDRFGNPKSAADFNGSTNYIEVNGNNPIIEGPYYTIMGWVNMNGLGGGSDQHNALFIQRTRHTSSTEGVYIHAWPGLRTGPARIAFRGDSGYTVERLDVPSTPYNAWHHFAFVMGPGATITGTSVVLEIYIDCDLKGTQVSTVDHRLNLDSNIDFTLIGMSKHTSGVTTAAMNGQLDDVRIYKCALNFVEICQEMNDTGSTTSIPLEANVKTPFLFPNPSTGRLYTNSEKPLQNIRIFGALGELLLEAGQLRELDLSELPQGLYLMDFEYEGLRMQKRIILAN